MKLLACVVVVKNENPLPLVEDSTARALGREY